MSTTWWRSMAGSRPERPGRPLERRSRTYGGTAARSPRGVRTDGGAAASGAASLRITRRQAGCAGGAGSSGGCSLTADLSGSSSPSRWRSCSSEGGGTDDADEWLALWSRIPLWILMAKLYGLYDRDEERADHSTVDES